MFISCDISYAPLPIIPPSSSLIALSFLMFFSGASAAYIASFKAW